MNQKSTIIIYADVLERFSFFSKFVSPSVSLGYNILFLTSKLAVYRKIKQLELDTYLFRNLKIQESNKILIDVQKTLSVLNNYHSENESKIISNQVYYQLEAFTKGLSIEAFFIWNGTTTIAKSISFFAEEKQLATRFFELSNLGELVFVDTKGTNANSYLYENPIILDTEEDFTEEYEHWFVNYRDTKCQPKQALNRSKIPWVGVIDLWGYWFLNVLREDRRCGLVVIWSRLVNKFKTINSPIIKIEGSFGFLPLQVSDDSQLQLFSDYSNESLIDEALKICREKSLKLVVKFHPAESDRKAILRVMELSKKYDFIIVGNDTGTLIEASSLIIVNNSTVGLEAMLMKKEILVFGRAFYQFFNETRLQNYILRYLVKADYFGDIVVSTESLKLILQRGDWRK